MCSLTKKCPKCEIEKPLTLEFYGKESRSLSGFTSRCKQCSRRKDSKWIELDEAKKIGFRTCVSCNESKIISDFFNYYKTRSKPTYRKQCKACQATTASKQRLRNKFNNAEHHSIREKLNGARKRAKEQGLEFNITIEDLMPFPSHCEILGLELTYKVFGNDRPDNGVSLDKIVPSRGYTKENVRIISMRANRLKSDLDLDTILKIKEYIERNT